MTFQPTPMSSSIIVEMDSGSSDWVLTDLTPEISTALKTPEVQPSEKQEHETTTISSVAPTSEADGYPDGGFAA